MQAVKWIGIPLALLGVGYFLIGPYLLPHFAPLFVKSSELKTGPRNQEPQDARVKTEQEPKKQA